MSRLIVVGGGLAGVAAAIRVAHAGHQTTLIEQNDRLGGKMSVIAEQGFVFDTGPTILTMPQVLDRLFASVGRRRADDLELVRLDPQWRAFFEDGTIVDLWGDREQMTHEIRRVSPADEEGYHRFLRYAETKYRIAERFFFWRNVAGLSDLFRPQDLLNTGGLRILRDMDLPSTVARAIHRYIHDPRLRQLLEHFMQYVGSSPYAAPAILCAIHHIQLEFGVWYPMGGINQVAAALTRLAEDCGVRLLLGKPVERLVCQDAHIAEVVVGGKYLPADGVIVNADFVRTHQELLPATPTQRQIVQAPRRYEPSCSGVVGYFGLNRRYAQLRHHDFFFSKDPVHEFEDIYERKIPTRDPTLCVCCPSRTDPSVAPPGCENVYILVHTPYLQGTERWEEFLRGYRDLIIAKLERCGLKEFRRHIQVERWMTPNDLEARYRVDRGAIYGMVSHGRFRGGFKPSNRSRDFRNLYFCGGSVHPGPGVPMALMSGQIAADCVLHDWGQTPTMTPTSPQITQLHP